MLKTLTKPLFIFSLVITSLWITSSAFAQTEGDGKKRYISCAYPLGKDFQWTYDIFKAGFKQGELKVSVENIEEKKERNEEYEYDNTYSEITMRFEDTYKNSTYNKVIQSIYSTMYIYDTNKRKSYPFIFSYLQLNNRIGNLIAIDIEKKEFKNEERYTIILLDPDNANYSEIYMEGVGLYYYRKGDLEYRLTDTNVIGNKNDSINCRY